MHNLPPSVKQRLADAALAAMKRAYAPYSGFRVGAALLSADGAVFTGCNVENASFGLTVCAERNAVFAAVSAGARDFTALAVASSGSVPPRPCGACLQVLSEFCRPELRIFLFCAGRPRHSNSAALKDLLPQPFNGAFRGKHK